MHKGILPFCGRSAVSRRGGVTPFAQGGMSFTATVLHRGGWAMAKRGRSNHALATGGRTAKRVSKVAGRRADRGP